jgi:hypothetical protein
LWFSQNKSRLREVRERIDLMDSGFAVGPSLDLPRLALSLSKDYLFKLRATLLRREDYCYFNKLF